MSFLNYFNKLDEYFDTKSERIFQIAVLTIFLSVGLLVYDYTYEDSEDYRDTQVMEYDKAISKLNRIEAYIQEQINKDTIRNLNNRIKNLEEISENIKDDTLFFDDKLRVASTLLYNQSNWSNFLNKVNLSLKENNIYVHNIFSKINDLRNEKVEEVFTLELVCEGQYHNILKFINEIEAAKDVVDVRYVSLSNLESVDDKSASIIKKGNLFANINISIWGIKY